MTYSVMTTRNEAVAVGAEVPGSFFKTTVIKSGERFLLAYPDIYIFYSFLYIISFLAIVR